MVINTALQCIYYNTAQIGFHQTGIAAVNLGLGKLDPYLTGANVGSTFLP